VRVDELKAEIAIEFDLLQQVVNELDALRQDVAVREPTVREKTAAAAFLAQFYTGIENILKRLSRFHGVMLPVGENWHLDLFKRFCSSGQPPLPALFDEDLERQLGPFRRFRHVVHHGYGFQIDWERMREGLIQVCAILATFRSRVAAHVGTL
jgi:hypothetical protein